MAYIGREPQVGNFQVCDAISVVNGQAAYTMQVGSVNVSPETANHMLVSLNGVLQAPGSSYTVSGSTITFASNLVTGDVIDFIQILGSTLDLGVPSDATVSTAKIVDGAVTAAKLASGAVANTPAFFVRKTGDQEINDSTTTQVTFDTEDWDSDNAFASNTFTVPSGEAGKYFFSINLQGYDNSGSLKRMIGSLYKNDAEIFQVTNDFNASDMYNILTNFTASLDLSAGDTIKVYGLGDTADGTTSFLKGNSTKRFTYFSGYKLIGV